MNAKLSPLPSGRLNVQCVSKKTQHATRMHTAKDNCVCSSLSSLPCGCTPSAYGSVPFVFPVRKDLFAFVYGSVLGRLFRPGTGAALTYEEMHFSRLIKVQKRKEIKKSNHSEMTREKQ